MTADADLARAAAEALRAHTDIDGRAVRVAARAGVVTLAGAVRNYGQRWEAHRAVKQVAGVVDVANELDVRLPAEDLRPDPDIACDTAAALRTRLPISAGRVGFDVSGGWIELAGEVEWQYQKESAESAVRWVKGVKGVRNTIRVKSRAPLPTAGWGPFFLR